MAEIQKSHVTITPPGVGPRFALLGAKGVLDGVDVASYTKRVQYGTFYEMYRQHPVVRSAIDRKADYCAAGGFIHRNPTPTEKETVDATKSDELRRFFLES